MSPEGKLSRPRKPLRRTAWGILIGGVAGTALMLGVGAIVVLGAPPAGPDRAAIWRDHLARPHPCTVTPDGRRAGRDSFEVGEPTTPDFTGSATITCDQPVALMTGTSRIVADLARGRSSSCPCYWASRSRRRRQ